MIRKISGAGTILLTVILMLLTCEVSTRLFARIAHDVSQRDPEVGRRFQPNLSEYVYNYEADAPVFLETNQLGFRGRELKIEKSPGIRRVAVLGDSYTSSLALPADETFCCQIESLLNESQTQQQRWEVLNFGMHGSGTGQQLALYRNVVKELHPDIVIVAFGNATDVRDNSRELTKNPIIQFELSDDGRLVQVPQNRQRVRASNLLNEYSRFYTWQKMKWNTVKQLIQSQAKLVRGRHLIYSTEEPETYARAWNLTAEILRTFRDECFAHDSEFLVVALPSAFQVYPDYFETLQSSNIDSVPLAADHPDRRLQAICQELEINFHSLTPVFL